MKPFKPPTLLRRNPSNTSQSTQPLEPPTKKRRINSRNGELASPDDAIAAAAEILRLKSKAPTKFVSPQPRKILNEVTNSSSQSQKSETGIAEYYAVLWRKFTTKKNKIWDGDGVLVLKDGYANLQDDSGKQIGRTVCKGPLLPGSQLSIAGRDVEVEAMIPRKDYLAGKVFLEGARKQDPVLAKDPLPTHRTLATGKEKHQDLIVSKISPSTPSLAGTTLNTAFKTPVINGEERTQKFDVKNAIARHDPHAPGALVMKRPTSAPRGKQIVDVVVDPLLSKKLREHQRNGVAFLYECVMGMKDYPGEGAILADEMGVGKTLQTIALLWTLLKQNPIYEEGPVVKKALIVCPVSLISNWRKEIYKWLGRDRIRVFIFGENKYSRVEDFTKGKVYSVMIIGYEKLRTVQNDLQKGASIDIVIADEGHRLKTAQNKSALAIKSLNTERRIILSGTPIQNDLMEFYTMVDFVNPGLLNKYSTFKREFEIPIVRGRQPDASATEIEKGEARSQELANITENFILRRTADILSKYLPSKTEHVVFCRPTSTQIAIYQSILGSSIFGAALGSSAASLELITILKKACNSPSLLVSKTEQSDFAEIIPQHLMKSPNASGKIRVLQSLLHQIRTTTDEKVVLVSNYTSTLDVLATILGAPSYPFLRLDGSTPTNKRQELVDKFNKSPPESAFLFLLSAKAGGLGLNLIGASRLILFDLDWNPSTDLQAMARVHRDGQKRPCYIYRLVTQGAIDEKIFQRQVSKVGLADSIVDGKDGVSGFTGEDLRDIFSLDEGHGCQTHRLLSCACEGTGTPLSIEEDKEVEKNERNDLATLWQDSNSCPREEPAIEVLDLAGDDDEDDVPLRRSSQWKTAKEYARQVECERDSAGAGKAKMLSLMQYTHFDTSLVALSPSTHEFSPVLDEGLATNEETSTADALDIAIEDLILRSVLRENKGKIGYVFTKINT